MEIDKFDPENSANSSELAYFGIAQQLQKFIKLDLHPNKTIMLKLNIDGLPLFKSSNKEFWPILGRIYTDPVYSKPFPICIYRGVGKPSFVQLHLQKFDEELFDLLLNGVFIKDEHFNVLIMCFICDRPARSFMKCIKGHTGYSSGKRCDARGLYYKNRVIFKNFNRPFRSDSTFHYKKDPDHFTGLSPMEQICQIDMVNHFVLDFMHLSCLGVMKKLLELWSHSNKWMSRDKCIRLSARVSNLGNQVPK